MIRDACRIARRASVERRKVASQTVLPTPNFLLPLFQLLAVTDCLSFLDFCQARSLDMSIRCSMLNVRRWDRSGIATSSVAGLGRSTSEVVDAGKCYNISLQHNRGKSLEHRSVTHLRCFGHQGHFRPWPVTRPQSAVFGLALIAFPITGGAFSSPTCGRISGVRTTRLFWIQLPVIQQS